jgi:predicted SprT family Zn-dependent metalloprotease
MDLDGAYRYAKDKLAEYGLHDWDVMYDDAKSRFGCCKYHKKLITLSRPLTELNNEGHVFDTVLHEIAHALVGPGHGHSLVWKQKALDIGCNGQRCFGFDVTVPTSKYVATCGCGRVYHVF